jgi:hypothetical protein
MLFSPFKPSRQLIGRRALSPNQMNEWMKLGCGEGRLNVRLWVWPEGLRRGTFAHCWTFERRFAALDCGRSFSKAAWLNDHQPYDPNGLRSPFSGRADDWGYAPREQAGA